VLKQLRFIIRVCEENNTPAQIVISQQHLMKTEERRKS
jgi:hypothetical protein